MIVKTLVENTSADKKYKNKHGLCQYIETKKHKILFDLGPNGLFLKNAEKMGIDISAVDTVIISHGHPDHGRALERFLRVNNKAKVYVRRNAFDAYYTKILCFYFKISLNAVYRNHKQIVLTDAGLEIDDELYLFADITTQKLVPESNKALFVKRDGRYIPDDFTHEQNLIVRENGKNVMFTGCSHRGITNIISCAREHLGKNPDCVIGGFHLFNPITKRYESDELIGRVAEALDNENIMYYTCHCTGQKAYHILKNKMQEKLGYLATGNYLEL